MTIKRLLAVFLAAAMSPVFILSCSPPQGEEGRAVSVLSWNVQNLFDDIDNGTEYAEFDPGGGEWNNALFHSKASAVAEVVRAAVKGGPDIVCLQEVENANALNVLNRIYLKGCGYEYEIFMPTQDSAVGNAVLSRFPFTEVLSHSVWLGGETCGRNIGEVRIAAGGGEEILLFVNHWKSKSGGAQRTEVQRAAAAELLEGLASGLLRSEPSLLVIACGDFNESWDEHSRTGGEYGTALLSPAAVGDASASGLRFCTEAGVMQSGGCVFYSPWKDSGLPGSYFFDGIWESIDHFFVGKAAFDGKGLEYKSFGTAAPEFMLDKAGRPVRWQSSSGSGYSDHLPVFVLLGN